MSNDDGAGVEPHFILCHQTPQLPLLVPTTAEVLLPQALWGGKSGLRGMYVCFTY